MSKRSEERIEQHKKVIADIKSSGNLESDTAWYWETQIAQHQKSIDFEMGVETTPARKFSRRDFFLNEKFKEVNLNGFPCRVISEVDDYSLVYLTTVGCEKVVPNSWLEDDLQT